MVSLDTEKHPEEAAAILEVIADAGLAYQWEVPDGVDPLETLQVGPGCTYGDDQVSCGFVYEHLVGLAEKAPHAAFQGYESPKYEWLGDLIRYVPDLGVFRQTCDDNGDPVFSADEVEDVARRVSDGATLDDVARLIGRTWDEAIAALWKESEHG